MRSTAWRCFPPTPTTPTSTSSKPQIRKSSPFRPGPNGPVGGTWIDLSEPTYGIHGTPDPSKISKTASHGCVRLTNWDAAELAKLVKPGIVVTFIEAAKSIY